MTPPEIIKDKNTLLEMAERIIATTTEYVKNSGLKSLILGVSGGIDSAFMAVIGREVCRRLDNKVNLIGRSLPIYSKHEEILRSHNIGIQFCHEFAIFDMGEIYKFMVANMEFTEVYDGDRIHKIRLGNIKARLRMMQLFHLAHEQKGMVLSTDNLTEYLLGFWTEHGDVGNYGAIQNLWKTEVYEMAKCIHEIVPIDYGKQRVALDECISAIPTDGLGITDSDFDQFGHGITSYYDVDEILFEYLSGRLDESITLIQLHEKTHHKRKDPINIPRHVIMGETS